MHEVLQLDINGTPQAWLSVEEAAGQYARGAVAWHDGAGPLATLRGGINAATGRQSTITVHPIIALRGASRVNLFDLTPPFTRQGCIRRDRVCCYCGLEYPERQMTIEHIVPQSKGGTTDWLNCAACCAGCNSARGASELSSIGFKLLYLPYRPSLYEATLLKGRNVRADVDEWLRSRLPKGSRLA